MGRKYWRASALAGLLGLIISVGMIDSATAHPVDEKTDAEHAKRDLAGTPIEQIEAQTRANAAAIKEETGDTPGRRTDEQTVPNARLSAVAAQDAGQGGKWSSVISTPVVPIFQAVLPNGKVLIWDSAGQEPPTQTTNHTFTRALVWNPANNTYVRRDVQGYNIFCAGYIQLPDGRLLVVGGNKNAAMDGIVQTHIFDWRNETWTRGPNMAAERWYPSVAALGTNEAAIVGGGPTLPEVYQTDGTLRRLSNASGYSARLYPFLTTRPDGRVELLGPPNRMNTIDTRGLGTVTTGPDTRDNINRDYGSFASYAIGRVLVAGGGDITEDGKTRVPTKTAKIVDVRGGTTTASSTGSMSVGRRQHNLTVLADGSVLATGGQSRSIDELTDLDNPVFAAERWDPATDTWTVLSSASRVRQYHSSATLLPDGRVLTGGGGVCASCKTKGYLERNVEYFEPPYLFKKDSSGEYATRPVIDTAPASTVYGQDFKITLAEAATIGKVGLVRLGANTHSVDQGQRYVPLDFTGSGTSYTATAPKNSNEAPAGYYMLFVTNSAGVPSVAKMIKLLPKQSDFDGDGYSDAVVSDPNADPGGVTDAGQVTVLYGNSSSIGGGSAQTLVQGSDSVGNTPSAGDRFGFTTAAADLDNDGYTDLLVGTPYEDIGGQPDSGLAQVIWGSSAGLGKGQASSQLTQSSFGRTAAASDQLGYTVDATNELGADAPMVAVGVPGGDVSGQNDAGWAGFFTAGLSNPRAVDANSSGIPGAPEAGDRFGEAVTLGQFTGTSVRVDGVVGVPGEDLGSGTSAVSNAGAIVIINDLHAATAAGQAFDQSSSNVPGTTEANDAFGQALDSVRSGSTTHLAVGIPQEAIGTAANAGSVQLFSSNGTTVTPNSVGLTQDTTGVTGTSEAGDQFGRRVVLAPPGLSDTKTRLAVSTPAEDGFAADTGLVQVFPLDDLAAEATYEQELDTVPGDPAANEHFGEGLGFVAGVAERSILVGVPDDAQNPTGMVNVIPLTGGSQRSWIPGTGGLPTTGLDRFGSGAGGEVQ